MASGDFLDAGQIALTGAAQQLTGIPGSASTVLLKNVGATNTMYLDKDNTVSSTTSWPIGPGEVLALDILTANKLWIIGTAADRIAWLVVK